LKNIEDNEIEIYESFYNTKNMKEVDKLFNKIETMIKEVKENDEFELNIDNNIHIEVTSSSFTCEHCKKNYSSVSSLNYHKKTNKSCLEIQQAHTSSINKFTCEFCKKEFTLKQTHTIHIQTCKEKRWKEENDTKELLLDYERQIKELQERLVYVKHRLVKRNLRLMRWLTREIWILRPRKRKRILKVQQPLVSCQPQSPLPADEQGQCSVSNLC
jgi:hypothetical protein